MTHRQSPWVLAALAATLSGCANGASPLSPSAGETAADDRPVAIGGMGETFRSSGEDFRVFERPAWFLHPWDQRFVLYDGGSCALRYEGPGGSAEYPCRYTSAGTAYTFKFDSGNPSFDWEAHGLLSGGRLDVTFNANMIDVGFEDGVYRQRGAGLPVIAEGDAGGEVR